MDLDYRALSNAGLWCIGRRQTDADRVRVIGGLAGARQVDDESSTDLGHTVQRLAPRWFVVRNSHAASSEPILMQPRETMSLMRGPMTRNEIRKAREWRATLEGIKSPTSEPEQSATPMLGAKDPPLSNQTPSRLYR